jgi:sialic acid synthase SpsE
MQIGTRQIGDGAPYVIAEIGVNHDGSAERALALVDAAAEAGADAIKLQLFRAELLMSRASRLAAYQASAGERDPVEMLKRLELSIDAMARVAERARRAGLHAIVTPFSVELVESAHRVGFDAFKTASPDVINRPLLDAIARTGKPMIVSTGAATLDEVARAADWLAPYAGRVAWLQCVSSYPTPDEDAAIRAMEALRTVVHGPVGYSDHTTGVDTGAVAAALGAAILEKHFTWSKGAPGPDHAASLEPSEFRAYASMAREEGVMRDWMAGRMPVREDPRWGPPEKRVLECEREVRRLSRQSLVSTRALRAGDVVSAADITIKRPGTGIEPWRFEEVVGRKLARAVERDWPIAEEDVAC